MNHGNKNIPIKQQHPPTTTQPPKSTQSLLSLLDKNEQIFLQLKQHLTKQLTSYQRAFSRQQNQYIEQRDFDHFTSECEKFKHRGRLFVDRLLQIKNNCSTVIKNLPEEEKLTPNECHNSFDMFVNEQVERTLEHKVRNIQYEPEAHRPFENQFYQFQNQ